VAEAVKRVPVTSEVTSSSTLGSPEVRIEADYRRLADLGIASSVAAASLRANVEGIVVTQLRPAGQGRIDVRVVGSDVDRGTVAGLMQLPIAGGGGVIARLGQATSLEMVEGPAQIERLNKQRMVTVGANVVGRPLGDVVRDFQEEMRGVPLPPGFSLTMGGDTEMMNDSFVALAGAILLSTLLIYMLMVALYESLLYPLVIMFALPVAVVGALVGLFLAGQTLNISSMIGMVMLMGLVGKNGILLVDYTNALRQLGKGRFEAIVEAATTRLRPIMMTTMTMVMAMIPVAFFGGPGSEVRSPMAVAVMGGLISSMLLTLVLVPVVYTLLDDLQVRLARRASVTPRYFASAGRQLATEGLSPMADPSFRQHRGADGREEVMMGGQKAFWDGDRASKW
jgi:hydrophobic/amphiphilic exporter-1 (mainly G- bacteria), HAE1 family